MAADPRREMPCFCGSLAHAPPIMRIREEREAYRLTFLRAHPTNPRGFGRLPWFGVRLSQVGRAPDYARRPGVATGLRIIGGGHPMSRLLQRQRTPPIMRELPDSGVPGTSPLRIVGDVRPPNGCFVVRLRIIGGTFASEPPLFPVCAPDYARRLLAALL